MAVFKIELSQIVIERATVYLEARTADEAETLALSESSIGLAEFRFADSFGDIEAISVQQMGTAHD